MYMYDISPYGYPSAALQCYLIQASLVMVCLQLFKNMGSHVIKLLC